MANSEKHLLVFGPGYSARAIMARAQAAGWHVSATWRRPEAEADLARLGISPVPLATRQAFEAALRALAPVTHVLTSVAPTDSGDPVLQITKSWLTQQNTIRWIGYLSSTNVYGDHEGAWVDEETPLSPGLARGKRRVAAEAEWLGLGDSIGATVHVFRLAGIYGPGRNAIRTLLDGRARRIIKPGQLFSRIHLDDIADAVWRAMTADVPSGAFNLADDEPAPPQDVIAYAARLLGVTPPPEERWEDADMSAMARSFYLDNKKVRNAKAKQLLGWRPKFPDYRTGLDALAKTEGNGERGEA